MNNMAQNLKHIRIEVCLYGMLSISTVLKVNIPSSAAKHDFMIIIIT